MADESTNTASGSPLDRYSPDTIDRGLMIACAVAWLLAIGAGVAATVALVSLGRGHVPDNADKGSTPWLLYTVIAISALVIAGAVPLLLRARRNQLSNAPDGPVARAATPLAAERAALRRAPRGMVTPLSTGPKAPALPVAELDRVWLRCNLGVLTGVGAAFVAVGAATYLMAIESDGAAWGLYGLAAVITVGMAAVPVLCYRQLRAILDAHRAA